MKMKTKDTTVWDAVLSIDLQPITERLLEKGITKGQAASGLYDYREFLYLLVTHPNETIVPTKLIDLFWHEHILDTAKYAADCKTVLASVGGRDFIHHDPGIVRGTARFDSGVAARNWLFEEYGLHPPSASDDDEDVGCDGETCG